MLSRLLGLIFKNQEPPMQAAPQAPQETERVDEFEAMRRDPSYDEAREQAAAAERYFWHVQGRELNERAERVRQRLRPHIEQG